MARGAGTATKQAPKPDSAQYDNIDTIEAAWLEQRPDLDLGMASTLLRLERVNQLHEQRLQEISRTVGLQTGELYVLLALRRSGKPYELRPTDLFRALLVTSGAMTKRVARLQEGGFILRVSANDDSNDSDFGLAISTCTSAMDVLVLTLDRDVSVSYARRRAFRHC